MKDFDTIIVFCIRQGRSGIPTWYPSSMVYHCREDIISCYTIFRQLTIIVYNIIYIYILNIILIILGIQQPNISLKQKLIFKGRESGIRHYAPWLEMKTNYVFRILCNQYSMLISIRKTNRSEIQFIYNH